MKIEADNKYGRPLVCSFPSRFPDDKASINIAKKRRRKASLYDLHINADEVIYSGSNDVDSKPAFKYAVGILDKETGTLKIAEGVFIPMESNVSRLVSANDDAGLQNRVSTGNKRDLGETFGTNKARKAIKAYDKGLINVEALTNIVPEISIAVEEKAKNLSTDEVIQKVAEQSRLIPPYDEETTEVDQVYKVDVLIKPEEQKVLQVSKYMSYSKEKFAEIRAKAELIPYVSDRIENICKRKDERKLVCLIFLNYLVKLYSLSKRKGVTTENIKQTLNFPPHEITERLLNDFVEGAEEVKGHKRYSLPTNCKNKIVSYICALTLHIESFVVNFKYLAKELAIPPTKLLEFYKQLGCTVETAQGDKLARLKAPVEFPKPRMGRRVQK